MTHARKPNDIARAILGEGATKAQIHEKGKQVRKLLNARGAHKSSRVSAEIADAMGVDLGEFVRALAGVDEPEAFNPYLHPHQELAIEMMREQRGGIAILGGGAVLVVDGDE